MAGLNAWETKFKIKYNPFFSGNGQDFLFNSAKTKDNIESRNLDHNQEYKKTTAESIKIDHDGSKNYKKVVINDPIGQTHIQKQTLFSVVLIC